MKSHFKHQIIQTARKTTVFETSEDEDFLRQFLLKQNGIFKKTCLARCKIREKFRGIFIFTEYSALTKRNFLVQVKGSVIFAGVMADFISKILNESRIFFRSSQMKHPPKIPYGLGKLE